MHDLTLNRDLWQAHRHLAARVAALLARHGIRAFNVMGAIGSGKTALIEAVVRRLGGRMSFGAVAGDVAGDDDYRRLLRLGIPAALLNTEDRCHLDAHMVLHALKALPLERIDVLFVENVGNLVCPADFPLGTQEDVVVVSVTEGDDMVRKHPKIFAQTDLLVINKVDLAQAVGVDPAGLVDDYHELNPHGRALLTDARRGRGIAALIEHWGLVPHALELELEQEKAPDHA